VKENREVRRPSTERNDERERERERENNNEHASIIARKKIRFYRLRRRVSSVAVTPLTPADGRSRGNFSGNLEHGQRRGLALSLRLCATRGYIQPDARYPPSLYARSAREFFRRALPPKINRDARPSRIIVEYHGTDVTKANPLAL